MKVTPAVSSPLRGEHRQGVRQLVTGKTHGLVENAQLFRARATLRASSSRRVAYVGALPAANLGDKAVFQALATAQGVPSLVPLQYAARESRLERLGLSGSCFFDSAIVGGGTLGNWYWLPTFERLLQSGLPLSFHGTGFGSAGFAMAESWSAEDGLREVLQRSRFVGVRGPLSLERVKKLGAHSAEVVGDSALLFATEAPSAPLASTRVLVNTAVPEGKDGSAIRDSIMRAHAGACRALSSQGFELVLVAMDPADVDPLRELADALCRPTLPVHQPKSPAEFMGLASTCRAAIAVRLHVAVLASCIGVPTALIAYRDKAYDFMASMGALDLMVSCGDDAESEMRELLPELVECADETGVRLWRRAHQWRNLQLSALASVGLAAGPAEVVP